MTTDEKTKCTFRAIIPNLQSAIQVSGDGGWRVKLDIPATDEANALELLTMRGRVLQITVELEPPRDWLEEMISAD